MRIGSDFGVVLESLVVYNSLTLVILEVIILFSLGITEVMKDHEHIVIKWYYWRKILCLCVANVLRGKIFRDGQIWFFSWHIT